MNEIWALIVQFNNAVLLPVFDFLGKCYNIMETTPFFSKNMFNFILFVAFFVWLLFYKLDIIGILKNKSEEIVLTIRNSENKKTDAIQYLKETKKSLEHVDEDVAKIVEDATKLAKTLEEKSSEKLKTELSTLEKRADILKDGYISKAKDEISKNVANAAIVISKEYIINSLDENGQKELIYNFINELENMKVE